MKRGAPPAACAGNLALASALDRMGQLLTLAGADRFRVRAYRQAARAIAEAEVDVAAVARRAGRPPALPGLGPRLSALVQRYAEEGELPGLEDLERDIPPGLLELLRVPRLGVKRIRLLHDQLGIDSLDDLRRAAKAGRLAPLKGVGPRVEAEVLHALAVHQARMPFRRADLAQADADAVRTLRRLDGVVDVVAVGPLRRRCELVPALDYLLVLEDGVDLSDLADDLRHWGRVEPQSGSRLTLILREDLPLRLVSCTRKSRGAALLLETGSEAHLSDLNARGGLDRLPAKGSEAAIYRSLGLPLIPPDLREGTGEIEAAAAGALPRLIDVGDLRGDLHSHTDATDGRDSLETMAEAARSRGLSYLAITDHTRSLKLTNGQDETRLRAQMEAIDRYNARSRGFVLLKAAEVDILEDGSLDLPDGVLRELDLTVCSIHSRFPLPVQRQTDRVLRAMEHPSFRILGHPTGRLLLRRRGHGIDLDRVLPAAKALGRILELNAQPDRLDLDDAACRRAKEAGVLLAISSDAHGVNELDFVRWGVDQARRGWIEAADVVNTRPLPALLSLLRR